jgi:hypothetical protein
MVAMSVVAVELREMLLTQERELDSREGTIAAWEDGLAAFENALGGCTWDVIPAVFRPRLPSRTTLPERAPIVLGLNNSSTSTGCWRSTRSSFAYRRWTWRCKR